MISETIGSGGDRASIAAWEASVNNTDDETGTCIDAADLSGGSNISMNAANTGSHVYLLTADTDSEIDAPTYAAMTSKARCGKRLYITSTGWVIERIGLTHVGNNLLAKEGVTLNRCCVMRGIQAFSGLSGTSYVLNCAMLNDGSSTTMYNGVSGATVDVYQSSFIADHSSMILQPASGGAINVYGCSAVNEGAGTAYHADCGGDENVAGDTSSSIFTTNWQSKAPFETAGTTAADWDLAVKSADQGAYGVTGWGGTHSELDEDIVGTDRAGASTKDAGCWQTPAAAAGGFPRSVRRPEFATHLRR